MAIAAVVLFHAGVWPFRSGYVGVDIFFVISGFLIGGVIYRGCRSGSFSFADFYARRARRILPMLILVVGVSLAAGLLLLTSSELKRLAESSASAAAAVSNFYFWKTQTYFSQDARLDPMLMTWTLGVEEQFYLAFPLILLLVSKLRDRMHLLMLTILTLASLVLSVAISATAPTAAFYLLPTRAWELGAGALLAVWRAQGGKAPGRTAGNALSVVGLLAIGLAVTAFNETTPYPGAAALLPVLGATALIASEGSWINRNALAHPVPVAVGLISYSWYLWHWPLMAFAHICSVQPPTVWVLSAVALVALLLAAVSWKFVEQPFRRTARPRRATILGFAAASLCLIAVSVGLSVADGLPQRLPPQVAEIEAAVSTTHDNPCVAYGPAPKMVPGCMSLDPRLPVVAIVGDSHAGALAPGLQALASQSGWGVDVFVKSSCRPLLGTTVRRAAQPRFAEDCAQFMDRAFARIARDPAIVSVLLAGLWDGPLINPPDEERYYDLNDPDGLTPGARLLAVGLENGIRQLTAVGKRVFVAVDVPFWPFDAARRSTTEAIPVRAAVERLLEGSRVPSTANPRNASSDLSESIVADAVSATSAKLVDVPAALCPGGACQYRDGAAIFYADRSHLTSEGAIRALAPWASELFSRGPPP
jgi:peptidoglycan/LPS O-acetylase OafA/YrhL